MKRASGIGHLKPFLPGLEAVLEDPEVSELMINGPGNVWVERGGQLEPIEAPALTAAALHRAAIHIARPLGLDPAARPILDARLEDGSRVAICTPPDSPHVAMTIRRFGGRAFSAEDLVGQGALPETVFRAARKVLASRRNILVSGGTGSGKTTLLNALIELLPEEERIVAIEDTLELRIERANCLRFEAGAAGSDAPVSIRDLVRHALRHRPDHIVVGEVRGGEGADASSRRRSESGATTRPPIAGSPNPSGGSTMKNKQKRSEAMKSDEKIVRVESLDDFDRELARDGGEALEVPASLAEEYGLFPEDVGTEEEIRDAGEDPHGPEEEDR